MGTAWQAGDRLVEEHSGRRRDEEFRSFAHGRERFWDRSAAHRRLSAIAQADTHAIVATHLALCDWLTVPAALLDLNGAVMHATPAAERMLQAGDVIRLWSGRLQMVSGHAEPAFRQAVHEVGAAAQAGLSQCVRHSVVIDGEAQGHLCQLSLVQGQDPDAVDGPLLLLTLRPLRATAKAGRSLEDSALAEAFDLSPGEAAVGHGLVLGQSARQIAEERSIPITAVRREMAGLYQKVGGRSGPPAPAETLRAFHG